MCMKAEFSLDPSWQFLSLKQAQTCLLNEEIIFKCNLRLLQHAHFSRPSILIPDLYHATGSKTVLVQRGPAWWQPQLVGDTEAHITRSQWDPVAPSAQLWLIAKQQEDRAISACQSLSWLSSLTPAVLQPLKYFGVQPTGGIIGSSLHEHIHKIYHFFQRGKPADSTKWFCNTNY